jgi:hypothetical protein
VRKVGLQGRAALQRRVVDRGDQPIMPVGEDRGLQRRVDREQPAQVVGVAGLVDPAVEQFGDETGSAFDPSRSATDSGCRNSSGAMVIRLPSWPSGFVSQS